MYLRYYVIHLSHPCCHDYCQQYPQAIKDTPHYKLWYRQDDVFKLPRGSVDMLPRCCYDDYHSSCISSLHYTLTIVFSWKVCPFHCQYVCVSVCPSIYLCLCNVMYTITHHYWTPHLRCLENTSRTNTVSITRSVPCIIDIQLLIKICNCVMVSEIGIIDTLRSFLSFARVIYNSVV